jgi:hypothetical protein
MREIQIYTGVRRADEEGVIDAFALYQCCSSLTIPDRVTYAASHK